MRSVYRSIKLVSKMLVESQTGGSLLQDVNTEASAPRFPVAKDGQVIVVVVGVGHARHRFHSDGALVERRHRPREDLDQWKVGILPKNYGLIGCSVVYIGGEWETLHSVAK